MTQAGAALAATTAEQAYYQLRIARSLYHRAPAQLDATQRAEVAKTAQLQRALERRIEASEPAAAVTIDDAQIEQALAALQAQYDSPAAFARDCSEQGLDMALLRELLARQLLVEHLLADCAAAVPAIDQPQALAFYQRHPEKFTRPEQRQVRHLLITVNPDYPENRREQVLARIDALRRQLQQRPQDFATLAQQHSECPTALNGGEIGWVQRGQLFAALDQALFALAPGHCSEVLETELGLHLLRCEGLREASTLPFDEVAPSICAKLHELAVKKAQRQWLAALPVRGQFT